MSSFLRLPLEIREMIYNLVIPYLYSGSLSYCWKRGDLSIAYTNKLIYSEVMPMLYSRSRFQLYYHPKAETLFRYCWSGPEIAGGWRRTYINTIGQQNVSRIRYFHFTVPPGNVKEGDIAIDEIAVLLQNCTNMKVFRLTFRGNDLTARALKALTQILETRGLGNVEGFSLSTLYDRTIEARF